jgi:hypothetical protein
MLFIFLKVQKSNETLVTIMQITKSLKNIKWLGVSLFLKQNYVLK